MFGFDESFGWLLETNEEILRNLLVRKRKCGTRNHSHQLANEKSQNLDFVELKWSINTVHLLPKCV